MNSILVQEYGGPDVLTVEERPAPEPGPGEVRIDVRAAGVNFADVEKRRGTYPEGPTPPYYPGIEVAGVVEATGPAADPAAGESTPLGTATDELEPGDSVAAMVNGGGYSKKAIADAGRTIPVPPEVSWSEAAAIPVQWITAHNVLHEWGGLQSGEWVLVNAAAGGVGTAAVQLAVAADATVLATASTAEKRELARDLGASTTIDYETGDVVDEVERQTGGRGIDLALDGVGGSAFGDAVEALAPGGRVVTYGMASGSVPTVATPRLFFENKSVIGYHLEEALGRTPARVLEAVDSVVDRIATDTAEVVVGETFPLENVTTAHRDLQTRESIGKLVLIP